MTIFHTRGSTKYSTLLLLILYKYFD